MPLELTTLNCPACGAPIQLEENVVTVLCEYCGCQVGRASDSASAALEFALQALKNGQYEQADVHFVDVLKHNAGDQQTWLGRAVAAILKPYPSPADALNFFYEAGLSSEEAIAIVAQWSASSSRLFDGCLAMINNKDFCTQAPALCEALVEGALLSDNPAHQSKIAQACATIADQKWMVGQTDQAVAYMKRALSMNPDQRPKNFWLLELAKKS